MHDPTSVLENDKHKLLWDFDIQKDHLISARRPDLIIINNKKRTGKIVNFAVPANHRVKLKKKNKQKDKYLALTRELKKLWNRKVVFIPIIIVLGTVIKGLIEGLNTLEIRGRVETIQTTTLLRSARVLRRVLET